VAELWFIGAGLDDERGLSERAIEVLRGCERVYAEEYTSRLAPGSLERLSARIGHRVETLTRDELESGRQVLDALESTTRVALLTPGDPFAATTHVALRLQAEGAGHEWRYLPGPSILTAAASFLGLIHYRFGRTVSLPFPEPSFQPTSPIEAIGLNRGAGLHSLLLLDLRPTEGRFLLAGVALRQLAKLDPDGRRLPSDVAVVARVGTDSSRAWFGPRATLESLEFGPPMHAIVLPAPELHFEEAAALRRFDVRRDA
jgi:diphthine synthase